MPSWAHTGHFSTTRGKELLNKNSWNRPVVGRKRLPSLSSDYILINLWSKLMLCEERMVRVLLISKQQKCRKDIYIEGPTLKSTELHPLKGKIWWDSVHSPVVRGYRVLFAGKRKREFDKTVTDLQTAKINWMGRTKMKPKVSYCAPFNY